MRKKLIVKAKQKLEDAKKAAKAATADGSRAVRKALKRAQRRMRLIEPRKKAEDKKKA